MTFPSSDMTREYKYSFKRVMQPWLGQPSPRLWPLCSSFPWARKLSQCACTRWACLVSLPIQALFSYYTWGFMGVLGGFWLLLVWGFLKEWLSSDTKKLQDYSGRSLKQNRAFIHCSDWAVQIQQPSWSWLRCCSRDNHKSWIFEGRAASQLWHVKEFDGNRTATGAPEDASLGK